ncbi:MAG: DUF4397 domain-containing protein [Bacteroidetes bacterium]|nr:DUF4397 domain-containing protein [Bacteroidota bacterium]HET6243830.1 DUF4397 domain-containing protein [Bacteroidia bacterium]
MKNKPFAISIIAFFIPIMLFFSSTNAQTARVQIIHNSADAAAQTIDIYVDGQMYEDNFQFRTATEYRTVPAGREMNVQIAPGNSSGPSEAIASFPFTLEMDQTYVVVASGIISDQGYTPAPAFTLQVFTGARETARLSNFTDVLVYHGVTDAPLIDIVEVGFGAGTVVEDAAYSQFAGYFELPTIDYVLEVRDQGNTTLASVNAPLATLGLENQAIVVITSGFLMPENNSNGASFGLFVALPTGGELVALPASDPTSILKITEDNITVFPNPATGVLTINFSDLKVNEINLIDITGKNILTIIPKLEASIDLKDLPPGTYFVKITTDQSTMVQKVNVIK